MVKNPNISGSFSKWHIEFKNKSKVNSKHHEVLKAVLMLFVCSCCCCATTLIVAVTPYGIIIGTDSKAYTTSFGGFNGKAILGIKKATIVQNLVVATADLAALNIFYEKSGSVFSYNFTNWIADINKHCPKNVSVSALTSILEVKSRGTFSNFDKYIAGGAIDRDKTPDPYIEYVIAGYQSGIPTITHIYFHVDWKNKRLVGPGIEEIHPDHHPKDFGLYGAGWREVLTEIQDRNSDAYKEMFALAPKELSKLTSNQGLSLGEAQMLCLSILRYETKHHEEFVAPPYILITIPPFGMGAISRRAYPK